MAVTNDPWSDLRKRAEECMVRLDGWIALHMHEAGIAPAMGGVHAIDRVCAITAVAACDEERVGATDPLAHGGRKARDAPRWRRILRLTHTCPGALVDVLGAVSEGLIHVEFDAADIASADSSIDTVATTTRQIDPQQTQIPTRGERALHAITANRSCIDAQPPRVG